MNENKTEFKTVKIDDGIDRRELFGNLDVNLNLIAEATGTEIYQRDNDLLIRPSVKKSTNGEKDALTTSSDEAERDEFNNNSVNMAARILMELMDIQLGGESLDKQKVSYVVSLAKDGQSYKDSNISRDIIGFTTKGKPLKAKTIGQRHYVKAIEKNGVTFAIGPAGTGKTYLAVAMAVKAYKNKEVERIILTRPAVEAGERLGFLPGDLQDKVDPYLRPLYDALYDLIGRDNTIRLKEKETIEVVPLAYMRGRTLNNAFIILDEAQNTTREQMKMFLTRMGFGSKVVVTGDVTQIDLPEGKRSGLIDAEHVLKNVDGIEICYLKEVDVVRHELVKKIIGAYERFEKRQMEKKNQSK